MKHTSKKIGSGKLKFVAKPKKNNELLLDKIGSDQANIFFFSFCETKNMKKVILDFVLFYFHFVSLLFIYLTFFFSLKPICK